MNTSITSAFARAKAHVVRCSAMMCLVLFSTAFLSTTCTMDKRPELVVKIDLAKKRAVSAQLISTPAGQDIHPLILLTHAF